MARPSPFAYARRMGVQRGVLGGSRGWLVVGGLAWTLRLLRRMAGRREEIAATEVLKPGQFVTIAALAPRSRAQRKADRRR